MLGRKTPARPGLVSLVLRGVVGNPMATVGGLMMTATAVAIMANALMLQPGMHPAPLFVGTRPLAPIALPSDQNAPALISNDGSSVGSTDNSLVADIQRGLKDFGYYKGEVDGLSGPQTSQAILTFERAFRLTPTGEPSNNVLLAIRSVRPKTSLNAATPAVDPLTVASLPAAGSATPMPWPKPAGAASSPAAAPTAALSSDGIADLIASTVPGTKPAAAPPVTSTPPVTATPPVVTASTAATSDANLARVQRSLAQLGFGPLAIDGNMSSETRDAIKRFQAYYGLPQTGTINEAFVAQMVKVGGLQPN